MKTARVSAHILVLDRRVGSVGARAQCRPTGREWRLCCGLLCLRTKVSFNPFKKHSLLLRIEIHGDTMWKDDKILESVLLLILPMRQ